MTSTSGGAFTGDGADKFYDAIYSPVILTLNVAAVVAVVMLLSASGNKNVLMLFGMSAGTAVWRSLIIFRRFSHRWKVWHGDSDDSVGDRRDSPDQ